MALECRICFDPCERKELIAPCNCKGSRKWVHRECLDKWRTIGDERAFNSCTECLHPYETIRKSNDEETSIKRRRRRYAYYVAKDCISFMLIIAFIIGVIALIIFSIDRRCNYYLINALQFKDHMMVFYSLFGLFVCLAIVGLISMCMVCNSSDSSGGCCDCCLYNQHGYLYPHYYFQQQPVCCICPDASCCRDCNCRGGDNDCGKEGLLLVIILAVIFALVGLVVSVFLGAIHLKRIFARHLHILKKRSEAEDYIVVDLEPDGRIEPETVVHSNPLLLGSINGGMSISNDSIKGGCKDKTYQV